MPITVQGFYSFERKDYYLEKNKIKKNQYVSYSVLSWKGRMDIDSSGSKGWYTILLGKFGP